jgi:hypothetical protein
MDYAQILSGGDLRSKGGSKIVVSDIKNQNDFDVLFECLYHHDRLIVMRAADAIEKVTISKPLYLDNYKKAVLHLCEIAKNKELKWHLAQLIPRCHLNEKEKMRAWDILASWVKDKKNSRIVRVNAIQALFEFVKKDDTLFDNFFAVVEDLKKENIPSINARIKLLNLLK